MTLQALEARPMPDALPGVLYLTAATAPAVVPGASRILAGQVVPWNVLARPTGYPGRVLFTPHSVDLEALADAPLLLDHEPARPIGRVAGAWDGPAELAASFRVAGTRDGEEALMLAAEGIRTGLSIGATVEDYELHAETDDQVPDLIVLRARPREVSLLTFPAWATARVGTI